MNDFYKILIDDYRMTYRVAIETICMDRRALELYKGSPAYVESHERSIREHLTIARHARRALREMETKWTSEKRSKRLNSTHHS